MTEIAKPEILLLPFIQTLGRKRMRHGVVVKELQTKYGASPRFVQNALETLLKHGIIERPQKGWLRNSNATITSLEKGVSPVENLPSPRKTKKADWREDATAQVRKARNFNPSAGVAKVILSLPSMEMEKLAAVWKNATRMLAANSNSKSAAAVLEGISEEWARRAALPIDEWFMWPGTDAKAGDGDLRLAGAMSEGMLSYLDYHVGRTQGEPSPVRHSILDRVFDSALPPVFPKPYMDGWGEKKSAHRLRKMAETMAAFARNAKRKDDDRLDEAIRQWEDDLEYLHDRYYVGRFGFGWPTTRIGAF